MAGQLFDRLATELRASRPVAIATEVDGPHPGAKILVGTSATPAEPTVQGSLGNPDLDRVVARDSIGCLELGQNEIRHYGSRGEANQQDLTVFIEVFAPPPRMLIFGAVDFTAALARIGSIMGYSITVCDAREAFATRERFPMADQVIVDWPHRLLEQIEQDPQTKSLGSRDAICILTHDPKFDVPAAIAAFSTEVGYIGAMGSRSTQQKRQRKLIEAGATHEDLGRLHAPIGLDLGARTPEEVAVSIWAEIIATHTGRNAPNLRDASGPLH